jgi:hypothetical protein
MTFLNFPEYADLGMTTSPQQMHDWDAEIAKMQRLWYYYSGEVLKEQIGVEVDHGQEIPLMFPVGLNLIKMLCIAQADTIYGEWDDMPVKFGIRQHQEIEEFDKHASDLMDEILTHSDAETMLWEIALDREIFGGAAMKIVPDLKEYPHIKWSRVPRESFFPIWNPTDPYDLLEVYIKIGMTKEQAKILYNFDTKKDIVFRVEHWTKLRYENFLDGKRLSDLSGVNPWGVVPFVYFPRLRSGNWFGDSMTEDLIPVQDELNMRIADVGDAINYNAHPTRYGINLPRDFNSENYPLGPNSMWNLGRTIGSSPPPEVGILEAKAAVQPAVFEHLEFVYDWSRFSSFMPPVVFGEDGGSQRSGDTLEIRMWPLLRASRRSRAYLGTGFKHGAQISAKILLQKRFSDMQVRPLERIRDGRIIPKFYNILPRDQQKAVDEVVKLSSTTPRNISTLTAQELLGRSPTELERIEEENKNRALFVNPIDSQELKNATDTVRNAEKATEQAKINQPAGTGDTKKSEGERNG